MPLNSFLFFIFTYFISYELKALPTSNMVHKVLTCHLTSKLALVTY